MSPTTVLIPICVFVAALLGHAPIFIASMQWSWKNISLMVTDPDQYKQRQANPPWYERYCEWIDSRVTRAGVAIRRVVKR